MLCRFPQKFFVPSIYFSHQSARLEAVNDGVPGAEGDITQRDAIDVYAIDKVVSQC
jgi:hypothetical protein